MISWLCGWKYLKDLRQFLVYYTKVALLTDEEKMRRNIYREGGTVKIEVMYTSDVSSLGKC